MVFVGSFALIISCYIHPPSPSCSLTTVSSFIPTYKGRLCHPLSLLSTQAATTPSSARATAPLHHRHHLSQAYTHKRRISLLVVSSLTAKVFATSTSSSSALACAASSYSCPDVKNERLMADADGLCAESSTGYLNAEDAAALDAELMSTPGFSLEQLMELAGLSVAEAVYAVAADSSAEGPNEASRKKRVLLVCGPGNNGGDGLVAARHLVHFGLDVEVVYPKRPTKEHFVNLVKQCEDMGITVLDEITLPLEGGGSDDNGSTYDVIVDAIFGFSFRGTAPREPFATAISQMVQLKSRSEGKTLLVSVDVPSGWDVNGGDLTGTGFHPDVLISLTAPKLSSKKFEGRHFVGGRFLPPAIAEKYNIKMPPYPGVCQVMEIL